MSAIITALHTYPIKSCAGLPCDMADYTHAGLQWDRHWVIVDAHGRFMTQRQHPRMALIQPRLDADYLRIMADGRECRLPLDSPERAAIPVTIWKSDTQGQDEGDEAAEMLGQFLGEPCRLLRLHPGARRLASPAHITQWQQQNADWTDAMPPEHVFGFADGFPFLVCNQASLDLLNAQLQARGEAPVPMNRFRPNIVVSGLDAYDEDFLSGIQVGDTAFAFVKACTRCPMPNVDQSSAEVHAEPGVTLALHRRRPEGILFGVNAVVSHPRGTLAVGEAFEPMYCV